ncbi:hypothetical protein GINT2_000258 [Glugoides intestinalis]
MRQDLIRKSKKWLKTLKGCGFREPYQIFFDASFMRLANKIRLPLAALNDLFKSEPKLFMTKCTYEAHKKDLIEKDFSGFCEIVKCEHETIQYNCTYNFIKQDNPHHYILASNNIAHFKKLRDSKFIPVLKLYKSILKLECNKLDTNKVVYTGEPATKREIKRLQKMVD